MKLTSGINRLLDCVRTGSKDIVFLFDDDVYAIKEQFGGSSRFLKFIEKEANTAVVSLDSNQYPADESRTIKITFLNGAEVELRFIL